MGTIRAGPLRKARGVELETDARALGAVAAPLAEHVVALAETADIDAFVRGAAKKRVERVEISTLLRRSGKACGCARDRHSR